jgi:hypothetical protein
MNRYMGGQGKGRLEFVSRAVVDNPTILGKISGSVVALKSAFSTTGLIGTRRLA